MSSDISVLLVDIDEVTLPFPRIEYEHQAKRIIGYFGYEAIGFRYRLSSAKGIHIYVWVRPTVELGYIPLLQYLLGSDFKRECINDFRFAHGIDINVLFTTKKRYSKRANGSRLSRHCEILCPRLIERIRLAEKNGIYRVRL